MEHTSKQRRVKVNASLKSFELPPVKDALIVGRQAPIGPKALAEALNHLLPDTYELVEVDTPDIEALIIRTVDYRVIPKPKLVELLLAHCDGLIHRGGTLHVTLDMEVSVDIEIEL